MTGHSLDHGRSLGIGAGDAAGDEVVDDADQRPVLAQCNRLIDEDTLERTSSQSPRRAATNADCVT